MARVTAVLLQVRLHVPARQCDRTGSWPSAGLVVAVLGLAGGPVAAHTPHDPINHLALSDAYATDGTAFMVVHNELKRTLDGGRSWHRLEAGICGLGRFSGLAVSRRFSRDRSLIAARTGDGLYASRDGGDSWRRLDILPRGLGPVSVAAAEMHHARLGGFAAAAPNGRLVISEDAGESWTDVLSPRNAVMEIAMAGGSDGQLHLAVAGAGGVVLYSGDRGATWHRIALAPAGSMTGSGNPEVRSPSAVMLVFESLGDGEGRAAVGPAILGLTADGRGFRWRPECAPQNGCAGSALEWLGDAGAPVSAGLLVRRSRGAVQLVAARRSGQLVAGQAAGSWSPSPLGEVPFEGQADRFGSPQVNALADDGHETLCAAAFSGLFCRTPDGPAFEEVQSIDPHEITGLAVAPGTGGRSLALATFNAGGWVSHDSGTSWSRQPAGAETDHFWAVAWPPASCGVGGPVFVGNRGVNWYDERAGNWHFATPRSGSPGLADRILRKFDEWISGVPPVRLRPKVFGIAASAGVATGDCRLHLGTRYEGLWVLDLKTGAWTALGPLRPRTWVAAIVRETGDQPMAASFLGRGVFEYLDGEWLPRSKSLPESVTGRRPFGGFKGAPLARYVGEEGGFLYGSSLGLYVGADRSRWVGPVVVGDVPPGASTDALDAVAVIPAGSGRPVFLASVRGRGLFYSLDAFAGFQPAFVRSGGRMPGVRWIVPEPDAPSSGVVYAAGPEHLYRSDNHGRMWARMARPGEAGREDRSAVAGR